MKKITSLPIKPVISNTICPITQESLEEGMYIILHCNKDSNIGIGVDKTEIENYVTTSQRSFKTPCCPMCRDEDHFKKDLTSNNISWEPYSPEDVTNYEGIKKILENSDYSFAALNFHKIESLSERFEACKAIITFQAHNNCVNSNYTYEGKTMVHILAQEGYHTMLKAFVEHYNLDPTKTLKDGTTAADIAKKHNKEDTYFYLENL